MFHGIEHVDNPEGAVIEIGYSYDANGVISVEGRQIDTGRTLRVEKVPLDDDLSWLYEAPKKSSIPSLSIILTIDESGSMCGDAVAKACKAAADFIRELPEGSFYITVQGFADRQKDYCTFVANPQEALDVLPTIIKDTRKNKLGICNRCEPIEKCHMDLKHEAPTDNKILVILTDGVWERPKLAIEHADKAKRDGIQIAAIGFGSADERFLRKISSKDSLSILTSVDNLSSAFSSIAQEFSTGMQ